MTQRRCLARLPVPVRREEVLLAGEQVAADAGLLVDVGTGQVRGLEQRRAVDVDPLRRGAVQAHQREAGEDTEEQRDHGGRSEQHGQVAAQGPPAHTGSQESIRTATSSVSSPPLSVRTSASTASLRCSASSAVGEQLLEQGVEPLLAEPAARDAAVVALDEAVGEQHDPGAGRDGMVDRRPGAALDHAECDARRPLGHGAHRLTVDDHRHRVPGPPDAQDAARRVEPDHASRSRRPRPRRAR